MLSGLILERIRRISLLALFGLMVTYAYAQPGKDPDNRLEIIKTDLFQFGTFGKDSTKIRKLIGNVHLRQDTTDMLCDSAYQYVDSNFVIAWSNVKIIFSGGRRTITSNKLTYDGQTKILDLYGNIVMKDSNITLYTDRLTYYRIPDYGRYFTGGKIVSDENVLTSRLGYYYPKEDMSYFKGDVVLDNPDYHLTTDTLGYNTETKVAFFMAPTDVVNDSMNTMYTEDGYYDTKNDFAFLNKNASVGDTSYNLYADTISFDQKFDIGKAKGHIRVVEKDSSLTIFGKYGEFYSKTEQTFITDSAFAVQTFDGDTLYLFADTLASYQDSILDKKFFQAYRNASIYMRDIQGRCDSLAYWYDDSLLYFYYEPVLWSEESQLSGDTILIALKDGDIDSMSIPLNAFITTREDTVGYNQIKGTAMQAKFLKGDLHKMWMFGNSESIYFTKDDEKDEYLGMNKATCSDMVIDFEDNKPSRILFNKNPVGSFSPIHLVLFQPNQLGGFNWRANERPIYPEWTYPIVWPFAAGVDSVYLNLIDANTEMDSVEALLASLFLKQLTEGELAALDREDSTDTDSSGIDPIVGGTDTMGVDSLPIDSLPIDSIDFPLDSSLVDSTLAANDTLSGKDMIKGVGDSGKDGKPKKNKDKRSLKERWQKWLAGRTPEEKRKRQAAKIKKKADRFMRRLERKRKEG